MNLRTLLFAAAASLAVAAHAQTVTSDNLNPRTTGGLTGFATTGSMMDGMKVKVTYRDGSTDNAVWGTTGVNAGGAFGADWSLTLSGDTFSSDWTFSVSQNGAKAVRKIFIDAAPGKTVFDIVNSGEVSPGSANGSAFDITGGITTPGDVLANYSRPLGITPDAPLGDLFTTLDVDLVRQAIAPGSSFTFRADTDNAVSDVVPEPASMTALALGALALIRRRRSR